MTKRCSKCGEVKPLEEFSRDSRRRDGRRSACKMCAQSAQFVRRANQAVVAGKPYPLPITYVNCKRCLKCLKVKALDDFRRHALGRDDRRADCRTCENEQKRRRCEANREAERARHRRYRNENAEAIAERTRRYREQNRDRYAEWNARRRAAKLGVPSHPYTRQQVFARHPEACWTCGCRITADNFVADHMVPLQPPADYLGPPPCDCIANLAPQCSTCSVRKSNRPPSLDLFMDLWDRAHG